MPSISIKCRNCGAESAAEWRSIINVADNPELKEQVISGSLFIHECPHCGTHSLIAEPVVYIDPEEKLIILCSGKEMSLEPPEEGDWACFTVRQVREIGELVEKVKIFHCGLDDSVMDLCKRVTVMEMKKEVPLKFFRTQGADNEIIFTYPENGQMEMIAIGFNVYEDCAAILRNHNAGD